MVEAEGDPGSIESTLIAISTVSCSLNDSANNTFNLMITEFYNWMTRRWDYIAFNRITEVDTQLEDEAVYGVSQYVRPSDDQVLIRYYTIGLGGLAGRDITYTTRWDYVELDTGQISIPDGAFGYGDPNAE